MLRANGFPRTWQIHCIIRCRDTNVLDAISTRIIKLKFSMLGVECSFSNGEKNEPKRNNIIYSNIQAKMRSIYRPL